MRLVMQTLTLWLHDHDSRRRQFRDPRRCRANVSVQCMHTSLFLNLEWHHTRFGSFRGPSTTRRLQLLLPFQWNSRVSKQHVENRVGKIQYSRRGFNRFSPVRSERNVITATQNKSDDDPRLISMVCYIPRCFATTKFVRVRNL